MVLNDFFFHLVTDFVSGGMILGVILIPFGDLGDTFSDLCGSWRQA